MDVGLYGNDCTCHFENRLEKNNCKTYQNFVNTALSTQVQLEKQVPHHDNFNSEPRCHCTHIECWQRQSIMARIHKRYRNQTHLWILKASFDTGTHASGNTRAICLSSPGSSLGGTEVVLTLLALDPSSLFTSIYGKRHVLTVSLAIKSNCTVACM